LNNICQGSIIKDFIYNYLALRFVILSHLVVILSHLVVILSHLVVILSLSKGGLQGFKP